MTAEAPSLSGGDFDIEPEATESAEVKVKGAETSAPAAPDVFTRDGRLLVNNQASLSTWLRHELGRGKLAGIFWRGGKLVYTPCEGEDGYVPAHGKDDDGPAQVRLVDKNQLASRCQYTYPCVKKVKDTETKEWKLIPGTFPPDAARVPVDVPDMLPNVRRLRGIVHTPVLRPDGTILEAPGYDPATGLLHLPEDGLRVPPVSAHPTEAEVKAAVDLIDEMLAGFNFVTESDRSNFIGLLLTPVLRTLLRPPYKLGAIGAPMPGSGKSLLASLLRIIHGGVFRSEVPTDEAEIRKQISTILDTTTGAVCQWDNATGLLKSSVLAGLLTSDSWGDRRLGGMQEVRAVNDRLWVITGNNLMLGGDLVRRTMWVTIDPKVPDPHLRTDFAIHGLESWAKIRRGELLHALLTMARAWLAAGAPLAELERSDSYAGWTAGLGGLLAYVGIEGGFDRSITARQKVGADDTEWGDFLEAIHGLYGDSAWTVSELTSRIDKPSEPGWLIGKGTGPAPHITSDALPGDLADKFNRNQSIGRALGKWLANREGRWAGGFVVRSAGTKQAGGLPWRIEEYGGP
jgi:hypothetical protein